MKDLVSKKHYPYKIHTLLMKGSSYPLSTDNLPTWTTPHPSFSQENLDPLLHDFSKIPTPYK